MRCAFLFPGQGSQYVGMGRDLYDHSAASRRIFEQANEALGVDLTRLCFEGPEKELIKTVNAQPAILTHSLATFALVSSEGLTPDAVAGHSVGEYSALVAAGALTLEDGVRLVGRRGELMYQAGIDRPGTMAALVGLDPEKAGEICERAGNCGPVQVANLNSPGQVVISGSVPGIEEAERLAEEAGAKRVVRLEVSGAFHSELMDDAAEGLKEALSNTTFSVPKVPVVTNVDGKATSDPAQLSGALERQLTSTVRWVTCVETLIRAECEAFIELGPGRVLTGLMRRIDRSRTAMAVGDGASFEALKEGLGLRRGAEPCH